MADYMKKIRDLLALAESPNEHEARSALLKARELMAKHKVSEADIEGIKEQNVVKMMTDVHYSLRRDPWLPALACTIAEHHCCRNFQRRQKGRQTAEIGFIGFSDDVAVCMEIFKYAVNCVRSQTNKLRKESVRKANGYGFGFAVGLEEAYNKQQKEKTWGLVMVVPKEVDEVTNGMKLNNNYQKKTSEIVNDADGRAFIKGLNDGRRFHDQKRLKGKE